MTSKKGRLRKCENFLSEWGIMSMVAKNFLTLGFTKARFTNARFRTINITVFCLFTLVGCAGSSHGNEQRSRQLASGSQVVCRMEKVTESYIKKNVCRTYAQIDRERVEGQKIVRENQRQRD